MVGSLLLEERNMTESLQSILFQQPVNIFSRTSSQTSCLLHPSSIVEPCRYSIEDLTSDRAMDSSMRISTPATSQSGNLLANKGKEEGPNGVNKYSQDIDIWKRAPVLKGTTIFEPRQDVKNIMVTGGAGFM